MEFKSKIAGLKRGGGSGRKPPGGRTREQKEWLAEARWPYANFVSAWSLNDSEIESILLKSPKLTPAFERGTVDSDDGSDLWTVQTFGWKLVSMGWSIVPQERYGENRKPAPFIGFEKGREKPYPFLPTRYRERQIPLREFLHLERTIGANLAIQCCAASSHIRIIDADCRDPETAQFVKEMAFKHLGITPFIRYGSKPKFMLIYRIDPEVEADLKLQKFSAVLLNADGSDNLDAQGQPMNVVEFLSNGALFTAFGLHHKTKQNFDWSEGEHSPLTAGPDKAPLITAAQLRAFINAVHAYRPIKGTNSPSNPYGTKSVALEFDAIEAHRGGRLWLPKRINGDWSINEEGKITDGADAWLTAQIWAACAANAHLLRANYHDIEGWLTFQARYRLLGVFRNNPRLQSESQIEREVKHGLRTASDKWYASLAEHARTGSYLSPCFPWVIGEDGRKPNSQRIVGAARPADGSLDWLPDESCPIEELAEHQPQAKTSIVEKSIEQIEADRAARALIETKEERKAEGDRVSAEVKGHIRDWLHEVVGPWNAEEDRQPSPAWVLMAPTGAGKTVSTISELAAFCRKHPRQDGEGPILLVLPTHANGEEAMATAQRQGMFNGELYDDESLMQIEGELRGRGVKITRFMGRIAAGCQRADEMQMLTSKGIGASGLCGAEVEDGSDLDIKIARREGKKLPKVEILCPFRERGECGYYRQMADLQDADVVIVSHAYLTLSALPRALRAPRAVIVDESVTYALLRQARMPLSILRSTRKEPYVTKLDKKRWPTWDNADIVAHYVQNREELCEMVLGWLAEGKDVAVELGKLPKGGAMLEDTIAICDRATERSRKVRPDLTPKQVEAIAGEATGKFLLEEIRWWKLVRDRMDRNAKGTAKGDRDMRWQVVEDWETDPVTGERGLSPHLRLSWRVEPNWAGVPMLLLDASAKPQIVGKLFGGEPAVRTVKARMRVRTVPMLERTWSNSSFIPPLDATDEEMKSCAENVEAARRLITIMAMIFGHGRVLVGTTIRVREILNGPGWAKPPNVDFVHFGALRGRDFAKGHVCAISIGRTEQPISVIDGYVAALTFDDDVPEQPYDTLGTGMTAEGKPLFRERRWQDIFMRTGQDIQTLIGKMPKGKPMLGEDGKQLRNDKDEPLFHKSWGELLEESWREEELSQFVGRLRPVHRGIDDDLPPPVYIAVGKILPPGVVVDELIEMSSVIKLWPMAEIVRLSGGVLSDNVRAPGTEVIYRGRTTKELSKDLPSGLTLKVRLMAPFSHVKYRLPGDGYGTTRSAMLLEGWVDGDAVAHFEALSERYGQLPHIVSVTPPKLVGPVAQVKPTDSCDVDRDDALEAEIEVREARYAQPAAAEHGIVEFEMRRARGLYAEEDDSALLDAEPNDTVDACKSTSTSAPKTSTPTSGIFSTRRFGQQSRPA